MLASDNIFCAQSEASIRISHGTGLLRVASQGLSHPFLKTSPPFFPTQVTAPWSPRMEYEQSLIFRDLEKRQAQRVKREGFAALRPRIAFFPPTATKSGRL